ncbi:Gfo/Idh/MocA family protein [Steroidobacter flavus]|uniref:Gfo/Idh/MocA family protein n=1 Tax=Steroidobacter flavus TaxID=1842136 RepID=A0ABV8T4M1_9GAMM
MLAQNNEKRGGLRQQLSKTLRYLRIYGLGRTWFKVAGRMRTPLVLRSLRPGRVAGRDIAMIGCGQFAFATIGYFIRRRFGNRFAECFDPATPAATSFAKFYGIPQPSATAEAAIHADAVRIVYIASNHASHTPYAVEALAAGKTVYVEKPVAVSLEQMCRLAAAARSTTGKLYAGYNRPFSGAIGQLRPHCQGQQGPLTLSCFISGHVLGPDHWYRRAEEGTRICGNVGHWLDLAVHMLSWNTLPDRWTVMLAWSNENARDDDVSISLTSERGDLVNIVLTARNEPFEGINETINVQWGETIAKIDDFRRMEVWQGSRNRVHRFWPKDVGHGAAILQPFKPGRPWREVELSTLLMLHITAMVKAAQRHSEFSFSAASAQLEAAIISGTSNASDSAIAG